MNFEVVFIKFYIVENGKFSTELDYEIL